MSSQIWDIPRILNTDLDNDLKYNTFFEYFKQHFVLECLFAVTSYERDIWFDDPSTQTRYIAILHSHLSHADSVRRCGSVGGATLANITTEEDIHRIWQLLMVSTRAWAALLSRTPPLRLMVSAAALTDLRS